MHTPHFDEDLPFVERMWIVERIGWIILSLVLLAAALGAFGPGLLSEVTAVPADRSYAASYRRFERVQSPFNLRVSLGRQSPTARETVVWISAGYLERMTLKVVTPQPDRVTLDGERVLFTFSRSTNGQGGTVRFNLEADVPGAASGELGVDRGAAVRLRQFFYP